MRSFNDRLVPLHTLPPLKAAAGAPDVEGWPVYGADGCVVGRAESLVVETRTMRVRYLEIQLKESLARGVAHEPQLLIPVGTARLERDRRRIRLERLESAGVTVLPAFIRMPPAPELEAAVRKHFQPEFSGSPLDRGFYDSDMYDQDRFFGPGEVPSPAGRWERRLSVRVSTGEGGESAATHCAELPGTDR